MALSYISTQTNGLLLLLILHCVWFIATINDATNLLCKTVRSTNYLKQQQQQCPIQLNDDFIIADYIKQCAWVQTTPTKIFSKLFMQITCCVACTTTMAHLNADTPNQLDSTTFTGATHCYLSTWNTLTARHPVRLAYLLNVKNDPSSKNDATPANLITSSSTCIVTVSCAFPPNSLQRSTCASALRRHIEKTNFHGWLIVMDANMNYELRPPASSSSSSPSLP